MFEGIKLFVYDFDGVMTNNCAIVLEDGTEGVMVNRSDGVGVSKIREFGFEQIIISTEINPVVAARAKKLKLEVHHGINDKKKLLEQLLMAKSISPNEVGYIGNDINDLEAMSIVGLPICPQDAYPEIKDISRLTLETCGGKGVIRELYARIANEK